MSLKGKIALITGASRGIGAAVAKAYAAEGAHCVLVARSAAGLQAVDDAIHAATGEHATLVPLDLLQLEMIDKLAAKIAERFGRLDILVGNAAILGALMPVTHYTPVQWHQVIQVNLNANWHLLRAFDGLLRQAEKGRVIFVTSGVAKGVSPYFGPYAVSKAALEMLAKLYAAETAQTAIRVELLDPGVVATDMRALAFPGEDPATLTTPETIAREFLKAAV